MNAIELLKEYKKKVDPFLKDYFEKKIIQAKKNNQLTAKTIKIIADFTMAGGKRIRPALVYYGYLASGGKKNDEIIRLSMGMELLHNFLLIHDDIIDRDEKRHNVATVHERYKKISRIIAPQKDNVHFGNSMAMLAGDLAYALANEIIFASNFKAEIIIQALTKLQEIVYTIVPGEMLDVVMEMRGKSDEKEVLKMYEGKTASYSFEGPLHLGSLLAGKKNENLLKSFSKYALPIGKAFQIRDDILGLFGDEKKLGKPIGADVIEGKQTLLLVKALEMGNEKQRRIIKKYLSKKDLTRDELEKFRQVIRETGALTYSQNLAKKFVDEALSAISGIRFKNQEAAGFLKGLANYMVEREM